MELTREEDVLQNLLSAVKNIIKSESLGYILIPIVLVALNWAAEAKKWQILSRKIVKINFWNSLKGVLSGLSMGFITPQSIGEYAGRILNIDSKRRYELAGAIFLGSFFQFSISICFGLWGAGSFLQKQNFDMNIPYNNAIIVLVLIVILLTVFGLGNKALPQLFERIKKVFLSNFKVISSYSLSDHLQLIIWSVLRYAIFVTQFVIVLILFDVELPLQVLISGVTWIFAAKTVIPAFNFLSDIGVREFSALLFFNQYQVDTSSIIIASLFIWAINILVPTIAGSFLLLRMKIKR